MDGRYCPCASESVCWPSARSQGCVGVASTRRRYLERFRVVSLMPPWRVRSSKAGASSIRTSCFRRKRLTYAGLNPSLVRTRQLRFSSSASVRKPYEVKTCSSAAKQSMHSSGSMISIRSNSWMQSTGQTSTQDLSLMSMQGSAMMYVTAATLAKPLPGGRQVLDQLASALDERGLHDHLVEAGRVGGLQAGRVGV